MRVSYKVIYRKTGRDITHEADWVLLPNGELRYLTYDDMLEDLSAEPIFTIIEDEEDQLMYFITVFTKYEINQRGFADIGSSRTVGYFKNKDDAINSVLDNCCDIFEYTYNYAVVEWIEPGLYNQATLHWFFKWNTKTKQYEPIEAFEDNFGNYAFGQGEG